MAGSNEQPKNVARVWYLTRYLHVRYETSYVAGKLAVTLFGKDDAVYKFMRVGKKWRLLQGDIGTWPEDLRYKIAKMMNSIAENKVDIVV
ncbi:hypothetical protein [Parapedobacter koreensis]|uniref:Uncharacterized protein n=1 Tax=Parapedobacter koreensis TaxID=332977 RepID=A0A1H7FEW1_9SPHI|nr:hypothetical protein [Parapedobacter koreensis]SEK24509.1 hypothetical protein SAMN05421740_101327 [Parapedobacter koreensis]